MNHIVLQSSLKIAIELLQHNKPGAKITLEELFAAAVEIAKRVEKEAPAPDRPAFQRRPLTGPGAKPQGPMIVDGKFVKGKHQGKTVAEVADEAPDYLVWARKDPELAKQLDCQCIKKELETRPF